MSTGLYRVYYRWTPDAWIDEKYSRWIFEGGFVHLEDAMHWIKMEINGRADPDLIEYKIKYLNRNIPLA